MSRIAPSIGRVRVTSAVSPSEAGYIQHIRGQMQDIQRNMEKTVTHIENITADALIFGLEPIFKESQRLVPVDTGKLKQSGFLVKRKTTRGSEAAIGYARHGRPGYAAFVHERTDLRHAPPTQAKFLETPMLRMIDTFQRRVALYISRMSGVA